MTMQRSRDARFEAQRVPLTWEVPAAVVGGALVLVLVTPLVVQGLVAWMVTGAYQWPTGHLLQAYEGIVDGEFGRGLPTAAARRLPGPFLMWTAVLIGEVLLLGGVLVLGLRIRQARGINTQHGLASGAHAAQALGLPRLRASAAVIRPDLYGQSEGVSHGGPQTTDRPA